MTLEWDCIALEGRADGAVRGGGSNPTVLRLLALVHARVQGAPGKPEFFGSAFGGTASKLLPTTAEALADEYFELLYTLTRPPRAAAA